MSCLEHLIENAMCKMATQKSWEEIKKSIAEDANLKGAGITAAQCWEICQYIYYTYLDD